MNGIIKKLHLFIILTLLLALFSCNEFNKPEGWVAKHGERYLLEGSIKNSIPAKLNKSDSTLWVKEYIENWLKRSILADKGKNELDAAALDELESQVQKYREELLINTINNKIIKDLVKDEIPESEIKKYYNKNKSSFILQKPLFDYRYVKVKREHAQKALNLLLAKDSIGLSQLNKLCVAGGTLIVPNHRWSSAEEFKNQSFISPKFNPSIEQLVKYKFYSSTDSVCTQYVGITEMKTAGDTSPLAYVKSSIKNVLLKKSRLTLLNEYHSDLFREAKEKNEFQIQSN